VETAFVFLVVATLSESHKLDMTRILNFVTLGLYKVSKSMLQPVALVPSEYFRIFKRALYFTSFFHFELFYLTRSIVETTDFLFVSDPVLTASFAFT
jgi:hypothetical protein